MSIECNYISLTMGLFVTVQNQGSSAAGPFVVDANGSPQTVAGGLSAGASWNLFYHSYLAGLNTVFADSTFVVTESNETNNTLSQLVPVPTLPPAACPPTPTPTLTNTPSVPTATFTPQATATGGPGIVKVPEGGGSNVNLNVPAANLWLCESIACDNEIGEGHLLVVEHAFGVTTNPPGLGLGAYEFQVEFDPFVIQSVNPADIVFSPGGAGAARGPANCSFSITSENFVRFGCTTTGQLPGPTGDFDVAQLDLIPAADDVKDTFPGNDNGINTIVKDNGCELADTLGHPVVGTIGNAGQLPVCGDLAVTIRILEGDLNLDCKVDVLDEAMIAQHYGSTFGSALYDKWFDVEPKYHDLDVDIKDLQKVFGRDGSNCQNPIPPQPPIVPPFPMTP
jgi:hypothetical protein